MSRVIIGRIGVCAAILALTFGVGMSQRVCAQEAPVALPKFSKPRAQTAFNKGVEFYQKEEYRKAQKYFKTAKKSSATKTDQKLVDGWIRSAQGGYHLTLLQRKLKQKLHKEVFFEATDVLPKYRDTPIGQKFNEFTDLAAANAVIVLEDFESPGAGFSKKYGKSYVKSSPKNPRAAFHGRACVEWAQNDTKTASQMQFKRAVPKDWTKMEGVLFWIYAISPMPIEIMARTPSKKKKSGILDYHLQRYRPKNLNRWERVFLPMAKFKKYGVADLTNVNALFFRTGSKGPFKVRVDYVCLVRKPTPVRRRR